MIRLLNDLISVRCSCGEMCNEVIVVVTHTHTHAVSVVGESGTDGCGFEISSSRVDAVSHLM